MKKHALLTQLWKKNPVSDTWDNTKTRTEIQLDLISTDSMWTCFRRLTNICFLPSHCTWSHRGPVGADSFPDSRCCTRRTPGSPPAQRPSSPQRKGRPQPSCLRSWRLCTCGPSFSQQSSPWRSRHSRNWGQLQEWCGRLTLNHLQHSVSYDLIRLRKKQWHRGFQLNLTVKHTHAVFEEVGDSAGLSWCWEDRILQTLQQRSHQTCERGVQVCQSEMLLFWILVFPLIFGKFASVKSPWCHVRSLQRHHSWLIPPTFLDVLLYFRAGSDHPNLRVDERAALRYGHSHLSGRLSKQPPLVHRGKSATLGLGGRDFQLGLQRGRAAHADLASDDGALIGQRQQGGSSSPQSWLRDRL